MTTSTSCSNDTPAADGTVRAVARAPARELRQPENSRTEPPDAGGPYQGEQHPRAVSRETANDRKPPTAARQQRSPLRNRPTDGRAADHDGCDGASVDQPEVIPARSINGSRKIRQTRDWAASGERLRIWPPEYRPQFTRLEELRRLARYHGRSRSASSSASAARVRTRPLAPPNPGDTAPWHR